MELDQIKANAQAIAQYEQTEEMLQNQINELQSQLKLTKESLAKERRASANNGSKALLAAKEKFADKIFHEPRGKRFYLCVADCLDFRVVAAKKCPENDRWYGAGLNWSSKICDLDGITHYIQYHITFKNESDAFEALRWLKSQIE